MFSRDLKLKVKAKPRHVLNEGAVYGSLLSHIIVQSKWALSFKDTNPTISAPPSWPYLNLFLSL